MITLAILALMSTSCFSQIGYPKKIVLNGDTVIAVTVPQMKKINLTRVQLDEARLLLKNTKEQLVIRDTFRQRDTAYIFMLEERRKTQDSLIARQVIVNRISEKNYNDINAKYQKSRKKNWIFGGSAGIFLFGLIFSIVK